MIFSINYTIDKFNILINLDRIEKNCSYSFFISQKQTILENLYTLRQQTFKDNLLNLIDHLIAFFSELREGGNHYLKHYVFHKIWEDMVMDYLKLYYEKVENNKIVFGDRRTKPIDFIKPSFHPNLANKAHFFSPDHYYTENDKQMIFDAKYKTSIDGIDYKQVAYYIFLCDYHEPSSTPFTHTYSSLILPGEKRKSSIHFKMDPKYSKRNENLIISEEYLDIREIINFYLSE